MEPLITAILIILMLLVIFPCINAAVIISRNTKRTANFMFIPIIAALILMCIAAYYSDQFFNLT